jgi:two-component system, cell cycle sensor histidine kinase and response regulator CckA
VLEDRTSTLEKARLQIVRISIEEYTDLKRAMWTAARISATTLAVTRVGIWSIAEDRMALQCLALFDLRGKAEHPADLSLPLSAWPAYLEAILSRRVVAAENAQIDPRTRELADAYLVPRGVKSMMDAPLFVSGEVWGVVCHEQTELVREWSAREIDFAVSVADMLSAMLEQATRLAIEERLRIAEAALARARQAQAVVRTASAIGHDVNTLLQAITGNVERALREEGDVERRALEGAVSDCQRAARVIEQLRELEGPTRVIGVVTDLSFVIHDTRTTLVALLGSTHALVTELAPAACVPARRADIERIVINLVVNAKEAMPNGGTVSLMVKTYASEVVLEIRDEGKGIEPEQAARVFDPYFTTKNGRNAGLGLFAVETIARSTGGVVSFTSRSGVGTTVAITWPRA